MAAYNKVIIMGRLTADPEQKQTQSGTAVTSFTLAVDRDFQKEGQEKQTDFITVVAWKQTAEFVTKYFRKGSAMLVDGSIQTRSWQDQQGQKRYATEVVASKICFCEAKKDSEGNNTPHTANGSQSGNSVPVGYSPYLNNTANFDNVAQDEDLPF
jgi:single-strand DNA-binding protein